MTGFIISVKIQLAKINSTFFDRKIYKINSAQDLQNFFEVKKLDNEFLIAWVDHFSVNENSANIIFQSGNYSKNKNYKKSNDFLTFLNPVIPKLSKIVSIFLNQLFIRVFNRLIWIKNRDKEGLEHISKFLFPLDAIKTWNYAYGKNGFMQFHFVIPENETAMKKIFNIFEKLKNKKIYSYLITIKKYKKDDAGYLSFPIDGYGVAMDFPFNDKIINFLSKEITEEIIDLGGKVYLAKDSILRKDQFERMYKTTLQNFKNTLNNIDFKGKLTSELSERLGFKKFENDATN
jgi:decaprenylphospho-beta-D-ribofuranose 2-oxidase